MKYTVALSEIKFFSGGTSNAKINFLTFDENEEEHEFVANISFPNSMTDLNEIKTYVLQKAKELLPAIKEADYE